MIIALTPEARARLDAHLDAVERALIASGHSRESRRGIVDDLEAQILDMVAAKSPNPALEDVETVLGTLDPPAAYGENAPPAGGKVFVPSTQPTPLPKPRYSRTAIVGFICILVSLTPILLTVPALFVWSIGRVAGPVSVTQPPVESTAPLIDGRPASRVTVEGPATASATQLPAPAGHPAYYEYNPSWKLVLLLFVPCTGVFALVGTVLGWVALFQIRGSKGAFRGAGLALFDGLIYTLPVGLVFVLYQPVIAIAVAAIVIAIVVFRYWHASRAAPQ